MALASDFKVTPVSVADGQPQKFEYIDIFNAIDENGNSVRIQGGKQIISVDSVLQKISQLENQLILLKAIKDQIKG